MAGRSLKKRSPKPPGRPLLLTPARRTTLLEALGRGTTVEGACALAGVSPSAFREWMARGADDRPGTRFARFRSDVMAAYARAEDGPLRVLDDLAGSGQDGHVRVKAATALLARLDRRGGDKLSRDDVRKMVVVPLLEAVPGALREYLRELGARCRAELNGHASDPKVAGMLAVLDAAASPAALERVVGDVAERATAIEREAFR